MWRQAAAVPRVGGLGDPRFELSRLLRCREVIPLHRAGSEKHGETGGRLLSPVHGAWHGALQWRSGACAFGNDATDFGTAPANADPEHDIFTALERWVEQGVAPSQLIGSGPSPVDPARTLTRTLCPYPQQASYKGSGDINDAANFTCALPR
jgi:hypothetical protein